MSLFIGNIFSNVRQEDLEHVFQKFGSCSVQVKDTFGFVHYDYPVNAERALQALRGTRICGQLLSLFWSNRQPKLSPGARAGNFHESHHGRTFNESHHGRNFHESYYYGRNLQESRYRRNFPESQYGRNLPESQHGRNLLESQYVRNLPESQHGRNLPESQHESNFCESQHERNHRESQHGRNLPESHHLRHTTKQSYVNRKLSSEVQMGHKKSVPDGRVFRPTDKPEDARNREKKNAEIYVMKKKLADAKREEQIDKLLQKGNDLENYSEFDRYEPYSSDDKRDHEYQGKEYGKRKRIRENQRPEIRSPERLRARKSRKTMSSPSRSDDKVSRSKSNSKFSRSRSLSSASTFSSRSDSHRSRDHRSKSGSRSRSRSRASMNVSTSSGRSSTPPTKPHNGKSNSFTGPERSEFKNRAKSGSRSRSTSSASLNVSTPSGRSSTPPTKSFDGENDSYTCTERNEVQNRSKSGSRSRSSSRASLNVSTPPTKSPNGKNDSFTSRERNEGQIRSAPLVENGNEVLPSQKGEKDTRLPKNRSLTEEILSPTIHNGTRDLELYDLNISKVDSVSQKTMKSLCLTSEEILMLIKHYGLKQPDGFADKDLPVESFFGCARLWPSEVVNYRRLKKGSISVENYTRRIFQNKAFGIVDRYVRSSSGWGEDTCTW